MNDTDDEPLVFGLRLLTKLRSSGIPVHHELIPPLIHAANASLPHPNPNNNSNNPPRVLLTEDSIADIDSPEAVQIFKKLVTFYLTASWSNHFFRATATSTSSTAHHPPLFLPTRSILFTAPTYFMTAFNQTEWKCLICNESIPAIGRLNQQIPLKRFRTGTYQTHSNSSPHGPEAEIFCSCAVELRTILTTAHNKNTSASNNNNNNNQFNNTRNPSNSDNTPKDSDLQTLLKPYQLYIPGTFVFQVLDCSIITANPLITSQSAPPQYGAGGPNDNTLYTNAGGLTGTTVGPKVKEMSFISSDGVFGIPSLSLTPDLNSLVPAHNLTYKTSHAHLPLNISNMIGEEIDDDDVLVKINKSLHPLFKFFENLTTEEHSNLLASENNPNNDENVNTIDNNSAANSSAGLNKQFIVTKNLFIINGIMKITHAKLINVNTVVGLNDVLDLTHDSTPEQAPEAGKEEKKVLTGKLLYTRKPASNTNTNNTTSMSSMSTHQVDNTNNSAASVANNINAHNNANININNINNNNSTFINTLNNNTDNTNDNDTGPPTTYHTDDDEDIQTSPQQPPPQPPTQPPARTQGLYSRNKGSVPVSGTNSVLGTHGNITGHNNVGFGNNNNFNNNNLNISSSFPASTLPSMNTNTKSQANNKINSYGDDVYVPYYDDIDAYEDGYDNNGTTKKTNTVTNSSINTNNIIPNTLSNSYDDHNINNDSNQSSYDNKNNITIGSSYDNSTSLSRHHTINTNSRSNITPASTNGLSPMLSTTSSMSSSFFPNVNNNNTNNNNNNNNNTNNNNTINNTTTNNNHNNTSNNINNHSNNNDGPINNNTNHDGLSSKPHPLLTITKPLPYIDPTTVYYQQWYIPSFDPIGSITSFYNTAQIKQSYPNNPMSSNNTPNTITKWENGPNRPMVSNLLSIFRLWSMAQGHIPTMRDILRGLVSSWPNNNIRRKIFSTKSDMITEVVCQKVDRGNNVNSNNNFNYNNTSGDIHYLPITARSNQDYVFNYYPGRTQLEKQGLAFTHITDCGNNNNTHNYRNSTNNFCNHKNTNTDPPYLAFLISIQQLHVLTRPGVHHFSYHDPALGIDYDNPDNSYNKENDNKNYARYDSQQVDDPQNNQDDGVPSIEFSEFGLSCIASTVNLTPSNLYGNSNKNMMNRKQSSLSLPQQQPPNLPHCSILTQLHPFWILSCLGESGTEQFPRKSKALTRFLRESSKEPLFSWDKTTFLPKKGQDNDNGNNANKNQGIFGLLIFPYRLNSIPSYYNAVAPSVQWNMSHRHDDVFNSLMRSLQRENGGINMNTLLTHNQHDDSNDNDGQSDINHYWFHDPVLQPSMVLDANKSSPQNSNNNNNNNAVLTPKEPITKSRLEKFAQAALTGMLAPYFYPLLDDTAAQLFRE